jgi:PASTA domain
MLNHARRARIAVAVLTASAAGVLSLPAAAAPPVNDSFAAAGTLTGRTSSVSGTNADATKEPGEPDHDGNPGGASIWYAWTAPSSGETTLSTCGSDFDTLLAAYTGDSVAVLDEVAANDDDCGTRSVISFDAVEGTTYRIAVDGKDGATGDVFVDLRLAPVNDDFADSTLVTGDVGSVSGTTVGASEEADEPLHYGVGYPSVWYAWTAPSSGWATFETCGSSFDTVLAAYVGTALADLGEVASDDDADCWPGSRISFEATGGTRYVIAVAGYDGVTGDFTLVWNRHGPPPYPIEYPWITGDAVDGQTLTVTEGDWGGERPMTFAFAWWRCDRYYERCASISGATGRTYVPGAGDVGWRLYVHVTASNVRGAGLEFSNITAPVAARAPGNVVVPFVRGRAIPGQILVATGGEWSGTGPMALSYQWQSCDVAENCVELAGEAAPVIQVGAAHLGRSLRVVVTATNPGGSASAASDTTALVRRAGRRCVVPNVKRKALALARQAIRRAGCTVGRIRRSHSASVRNGRVISQSPRPGARRAAGTRVNLVLSRGKKR